MIITINPNNQFSNIHYVPMVGLAGLIPFFALKHNPHEEQSMRLSIVEQYGHGVHYMPEGNHDDDGTFHFPEDPPLHPIMKIQCEFSKDICFIYEHGLVSFFENTKTGLIKLHTRMD